jgi:hypothetical protein
MLTINLLSTQIAAGWLLVLSGLIFLPGGLLFTRRVIWKRTTGKNPVYLYWERGLVIAAVVVVVLGWGLLERMLEAAGDTILAPSGLILLILSAGLVLAAELYNLSKQAWLQPLIVVHVVLAFLSQAVFGASLLQTGLLPAWVGWAAILWSMGMLVYLPAFKPRDIYYPWVHYVAPLIIGIGLLVRG